jgi:hypothetical protein
MKCFKCGKTIDDDNTLDFYPVEPYGPNRKWACSDCIKNNLSVRYLYEKERIRMNHKKGMK